MQKKKIKPSLFIFFQFHIGPNIHAELVTQFGSIANIDIDGWSVSDDQVMNLHGAEALGRDFKALK